MSKTKLIPFDVEKAKNGARVVTRDGRRVRIALYDVNDENFPISAAVKYENTDRESIRAYTIDGHYYKDSPEESPWDLFIEEVVVETSNESKDTLNPDDIKIEPDKWYVCQSTNSSNLGFKGIKDKFWFIEGKVYSGTDILYWSSGFTLDNYEHYFRPWNIYDAKPGDILASKTGDNILIFGYIDKDDYRTFYSRFDIHEKGCGWNVKNYIPATKEQINILVKKMKEKGYM